MKGRSERKWDERKGKSQENQKDMKEQKERSVRFCAWHGGTMKGYEQIMEGHGSNAHEKKVEVNEINENKVM